jgi:plasmid stabilization system protein ParE
MAYVKFKMTSPDSSAEHPYLYKPSLRKLGWCEIVVQPNYIVFYKVTDKVYIMAVAHSRQMYPS